VAADDKTPPEPYWVRIRRLRKAAGLSQPALYHRTEGVGFDTLRALERPYQDQRNGVQSRSRYPSADTLERVAEALEIDPSEFPEYRLARARERLDERHVGMNAALAALDEWAMGALLLGAQKATESEPQTQSDLGPRSIPDAPANAGEAG
jgi:transcriptional regulator with XRE-family HTH domain